MYLLLVAVIAIACIIHSIFKDGRYTIKEKEWSDTIEFKDNQITYERKKRAELQADKERLLADNERLFNENTTLYAKCEKLANVNLRLEQERSDRKKTI